MPVRRYICIAVVSIVVHVETGSFEDYADGKNALAQSSFASFACGERRIAHLLEYLDLRSAIRTFVSVNWHYCCFTTPSETMKWIDRTAYTRRSRITHYSIGSKHAT